MQLKLPKLILNNNLCPSIKDFLSQLKQSGFKGDIDSSYSTRLTAATDNSVYQVIPEVVVFPKSTKDIQKLTLIAAKPAFHNIHFSARGGGTGTNGQSLNTGIIVDLSRHMNKVIEINEKEGWIRVQAGIIKDQLNDAVSDLGYFFSPDLSTSNRATIGGMINTDASGQGSLRYGKTSNHVLSLQAVFTDGSILETNLSKGPPKKGTVAQKAYNKTQEICQTHRKLIEDKFPDLNRFLTGYDLKNTISFNQAGETQFDFTRILTGSEGTLAFICEAQLNLTKLPKIRRLINIQYDSFYAALKSAPLMLSANALSVETIDSKVLNLAKKDIIWHTISELLPDVAQKTTQGINIVEFAGNDQSIIDQQVKQLCKQLDQTILKQASGMIHYQICNDLSSIQKIYAMRKKAVGLLGATKGREKPIPFVEDTCVPPENLADFITEFRALLDHHHLEYGMFGHVDTGVLHVRPALDLCDANQENLMQQISDQVAKLVLKYGGLMWGEHGKGYRSEYVADFFGKELWEQLRHIKTVFDPYNQMNPGKICTPTSSSMELVKVSGDKRAHFDRQIPIAIRDSFEKAIDCNGNGLCFNYQPHSNMCPSMKGTLDKRHSPKGRAALIREWLRLLNNQQINSLSLEKKLLNQSIHQKITSSLTKPFSRTKDDFSYEVYQALDGCLGCKACATECPIRVDVAQFKSRFLHIYHSRYQRPLKDYLVAHIETLIPILAKFPVASNYILQQKWLNTLLKKTVGYTSIPKLSVPPLQKTLNNKFKFNLPQLQALSATKRQEYLLIVQDPFSSFYDASIIKDLIKFALLLNKKPIILPFHKNGKGLHVKGFLQQFKKSSQQTAYFLNKVATLDIKMVGVDPATVLCYRDEYLDILGKEHIQFHILTVDEWLISILDNLSINPNIQKSHWYLFAHCTEKAKLTNLEKDWQAIFRLFNAELELIPTTCCGMAGTFGHETNKLALSKKIYQLSWQKKLNQLNANQCLTTGYSCKSQVNRIDGLVLKHPIQALLQLLETNQPLKTK